MEHLKVLHIVLILVSVIVKIVGMVKVLIFVLLHTPNRMLLQVQQEMESDRPRQRNNTNGHI